MNSIEVETKYANAAVEILEELKLYLNESIENIKNLNYIINGEANAELAAVIYELPNFEKELRDIDTKWNTAIDKLVFGDD